jgi:ActR/RegA family two-component response regulator
VAASVSARAPNCESTNRIKAKKILVLGLDPVTHGGLLHELRARGHLVGLVANRSELTKAPVLEGADTLVTELRLSSGPTTSLLRRLRRTFPMLRLIVVTRYDSIATAVACTRLGVSAYFTSRDSLCRVADGVEGKSGPEPLIPERPMRLERAVWEHINSIATSAGSIVVAAKWLGVDRRSLRRMLSRYAPPG